MVVLLLQVCILKRRWLHVYPPPTFLCGFCSVMLCYVLLCYFRSIWGQIRAELISRGAWMTWGELPKQMPRTITNRSEELAHRLGSQTRWKSRQMPPQNAQETLWRRWLTVIKAIGGDVTATDSRDVIELFLKIWPQRYEQNFIVPTAVFWRSCLNQEHELNSMYLKCNFKSLFPRWQSQICVWAT